MLPIVARTAEEALRLVPTATREAALALGVPRYRVVLRIVLSSSRSAVITGALLAVARAAGRDGAAHHPRRRATRSRRSGSDPTACLHSTSASLTFEMYNIIQSPYPNWITVRLGHGAHPHPYDARDQCSRPARAAQQVRGGAAMMEGTKLEDERTNVEGLPTKLSVRGLSAWYGKTLAIEKISIDFTEKAVTAIIGPSGCGKSTFIRCLNRIHETAPGAKASGRVVLDGEDIYALDPVAVRRRIGMVFQKPNPFPTMSIYGNVASGLRLNGIRDRKVINRAGRPQPEGRRPLGRGQGPTSTSRG